MRFSGFNVIMNLRTLLVVLLAVPLSSCDKPELPKPPLNSDGSLNINHVAWLAANRSSLGSDDKDYPLEVTFRDTVSSVNRAPSGQWYLHFGGSYPTQVLSVWVPKTYSKRWRAPYFDSLVGQRVEVSGFVRYYHDQLEVVVHDSKQVTLLTSNSQ